MRYAVLNFSILKLSFDILDELNFLLKLSDNYAIVVDNLLSNRGMDKLSILLDIMSDRLFFNLRGPYQTMDLPDSNQRSLLHIVNCG